jgi:hypothetical protein
MLGYGRAETPFPTVESKAYRPNEEPEETEFKRADRNIYPDDVRKNMSGFPSTTVALQIEAVGPFELKGGHRTLRSAYVKGRVAHAA